MLSRRLAPVLCRSQPRRLFSSSSVGYDFIAPPARHLLPKGVQDKLTEYPVSVTFPTTWGHQDMFGHINNVHYFRFLENARLEMLQEAYHHMTPELHDEMMRAKGVGVILATSSIVYKVPVKYPDALTVGCRIAEWKEDRFLLQYRVVSHKLEKTAAEGDGWMVVYDYRLNKKTAAPHYLKSALESINTRRFDANGHPVVSKPSSQQHHHHTKPEAKHT